MAIPRLQEANHGELLAILARQDIRGGVERFALGKVLFGTAKRHVAERCDVRENILKRPGTKS